MGRHKTGHQSLHLIRLLNPDGTVKHEYIFDKKHVLNFQILRKTPKRPQRLPKIKLETENAPIVVDKGEQTSLMDFDDHEQDFAQTYLNEIQEEVLYSVDQSIYELFERSLIQ